MTMTEDAPARTVLGQRLLRKEDPALLTGEAKFTNDLHVPGRCTWRCCAARTRTPASTRSTCRSALADARRRGRVRGADLADLWAGPMPCAWPVTADMKNPPHYPLATTKAATSATAWRACSPTRPRRATRSSDRGRVRAAAGRGRPRGRAVRPRGDPRRARHEQELHLGPPVEETEGAGRRGVRRAAYTVKRALRPAAADPDGDGAPRRARDAAAVRRRHDAVLSTQVPHILKVMTAITLGHPRAPDARGRPGGRRRLRLEAQRVRRRAALHGARPQARVPVRWNEERSENSMATIHGRAQIQTSSSPPTPTASSPPSGSA
jgi:aerobic carbon-monoxide dehydrogenase large subunit